MKMFVHKTLRVVFGFSVIVTGTLTIIGSGGGPVYNSPEGPYEAQKAKERQTCQSLLDTADIGSKPKNYRSLIESHMRETLKDPDSAQYAWNKAVGPNKGFGSYAIPDTCYLGWAVCVSINAKNSYGGYVGSQRWFFIIRDNSVTFGIKYDPIENTSGCS